VTFLTGQQAEKYFLGSNKKYFISERQKKLKPESANGKPVYDSLTAEIKLRDYSPKTLKAYTGWVRGFKIASLEPSA
jgi:hypothetical protein